MKIKIRAVYRFTVNTEDPGTFGWIARLLTELLTVIRRVDRDATLHIQDQEVNHQET